MQTYRSIKLLELKTEQTKEKKLLSLTALTNENSLIRYWLQSYEIESKKNYQNWNKTTSHKKLAQCLRNSKNNTKKKLEKETKSV